MYFKGCGISFIFKRFPVRCSSLAFLSSVRSSYQSEDAQGTRWQNFVVERAKSAPWTSCLNGHCIRMMYFRIYVYITYYYTRCCSSLLNIHDGWRDSLHAGFESNTGQVNSWACILFSLATFKRSAEVSQTLWWTVSP